MKLEVMVNFVDVVLYIILPIITAGYLFLKKKFSFFADRNIPHIKPSWLLGNMDGVGKTISMMDFMRTLYDECKGKDVIAGFYTMFAPSFIVTDLELVKQITVKDFASFSDRGIYVNEENEPITGHLFSISGEKWMRLRSKLSPVFTSGKIKMMYNTISDKGENFVAALQAASAAGSVDIKEMANRFTIDVVSSCAFGMEANTLKNEHPEFVNVFKKMFQLNGPAQMKSIFVFLFPNLSKFFNLRLFDKSISDFFDEVVGGSIKYRETNNVVRNDFLNMLIQLKNKGTIDGEISTETRKLTLNECIAQAFIFFFAGADTSSTTVAYAITELSHHPDIQEKLRTEILKKTEGSNGEITYDNLHEMTYLSQVANGELFRQPNFKFKFEIKLNSFRNSPQVPAGLFHHP